MSPGCTRCRLTEDNTSHVLYNCGKSVEFWVASPFVPLCDNARGMSFKGILEVARSAISLEDFCYVFVGFVIFKKY